MSREDREERIARLSTRFRRQPADPAVRPSRIRERQSFYLDARVVARLDVVYHDLVHELYPRKLSKSAFLEALFEHGLDDLDAIRTRLTRPA